MEDIMKSEIRTNRQGEDYTYYFVPVLFDLPGNACAVELGDNEEVAIHCGADWERTHMSMSFRDYLNSHVEDAIVAKFEQSAPHFIRCTDNKSEPELAARGELRPSHNFRDNIDEGGVSVACDYGYVAAGEYKYAYFVDGEVVGYGSDGEPLLNPSSISVVGAIMTRLQMIKRHASKAKEQREAKLLSCGWSAPAFVALAVPFMRQFGFDFQ